METVTVNELDGVSGLNAHAAASTAELDAITESR